MPSMNSGDREQDGVYGQRAQQLSEYDARLLLDRTYVHPPLDGCGTWNLQVPT